MRRLAGTGKKLTLELGGKAANIVFDDCALDQAVEGIVNGIYFNQGHVCCAGSRLFAQESIYEPLVEKLKQPARDAARRRSARQEHRRRRDQLEDAARQDHGARRRRQGGRRRDLPAAVPPAGEGLLVRADRLHERRAELPHRAGGDLRPGAERAHLPHAGGSGREGEQHAVRAERRRLDGEGLAHPLDGEPAARRRRLGEHVQPLRPDVAVRRLQGVGLRPRGRPPRARAVSAGSTNRASVADRVQEDVQALHRRRVPAQRVRPHVRGRRTERRARLAQGRARRGHAPRAARSPAGRTRPRTTAARCSTASRRWSRRAPASSPISAAAAKRSSARSIASSGTPAGPTSCRRCSAARTRSQARTSTSRSRSRPVSSPCSRPTSRRCSASSRACCRRSSAGTRSSLVASETHPLAAIELAEAIATSDVPGGVVNILTGFRAELGPDPRGAHGRERDRPLRRRRPVDRARGELPAENVKRVVRGRADVQSPWEIASFLELKTVWHPIGQ